MSLAEPIGVTLSVSAVLERLGVEYLVGGSLASSLHGIPRATLDVDMIADLRMAHVQPLVAALEREFFIDADMVTDAVRRRATFNVLHLATMFKIDVFVVSDDELLVAEPAHARGATRPRVPRSMGHAQGARRDARARLHGSGDPNPWVATSEYP